MAATAKANEAVNTGAKESVKAPTPAEVRAAMPDRLTGKWVYEYIASLPKVCQERFASLQKRYGITIPKTETILRSKQIEVFMKSF